MKVKFCLLISLIVATSCRQKETKSDKKPDQPLIGSWHLISSKSITKGDTTVTTPPKDQEMVKIFNGTDFAFFTHDLKKGKVDKPVFDSGSGTYTLQGNNYSEHLAYCNYRDWENRDFKFTVQFKNDTLVQTGIEKIDSLKIDHEIIETYVKMR
ncbi:hypothetical protein [Mucilaginibacter pocheonensis]|uniref:Lipocalin-like domain-containing protein n=1 Tax=Mucilaginibacter pocheonensis TaxID=398050 RepID=A0ABU1TDA7_9SPHI|nr:hypothetical protein [Mucilaginibacter pocheonensis]MDR6943264.1 hypothetical protein [Mucilaginibacter pocheonensis]